MGIHPSRDSGIHGVGRARRAAYHLLAMADPAPCPHALTVLLVESSPMLAERLLRLVTSRHGVAAASARSRDEALAQLRASRFALVVADIDIDDASDLSGLRRLRGAAAGSRFVVLTTDADPETDDACRDIGADAVVALPGGIRRLLAVVDELRGGGTGGRSDRIAPG
jgi:DNA-binding response OmpR family regulator